MKPINFFSDEITIDVHTASDVKYIKRGKVSVREFADGDPVSLYELGNGDYLLRKGNSPSAPFIEGKSV